MSNTTEKSFKIEEIATFVSGVMLVKEPNKLLELASFVMDKEIDTNSILNYFLSIKRRILHQYPFLHTLESMEEFDETKLQDVIKTIQNIYGNEIVLHKFKKKSFFERIKEIFNFSYSTNQ